MSPQRIVLASITATVVGLFVATCANNLHTAIQRSRQKKTMAAMRDAGMRIEAGKPVGTPRDGWGTPMAVRIRGPHHYSIRAAMSDRRFQRGNPYHPTTRFDEDVVLVDGAFAQAPEGL